MNLAEGRATPEPRSLRPKHLAEKILTSRAALDGERKQVTVLFADVKRLIEELGQKVDAREWYRIMDRFFLILSDGVHRFKGTVDKFTGDGIMALLRRTFEITFSYRVRRADRLLATIEDPAVEAWISSDRTFRALHTRHRNERDSSTRRSWPTTELGEGQDLFDWLAGSIRTRGAAVSRAAEHRQGTGVRRARLEQPAAVETGRLVVGQRRMLSCVGGATAELSSSYTMTR